MGDTRPQQDLAQHHEHRDGDQDVFRARVPDDIAHRQVERDGGEELVERQAEDAHDGGHRNADGKECHEEEQGGAEHA